LSNFWWESGRAWLAAQLPPLVADFLHGVREAPIDGNSIGLICVSFCIDLTSDEVVSRSNSFTHGHFFNYAWAEGWEWLAPFKSQRPNKNRKNQGSSQAPPLWDFCQKQEFYAAELDKQTRIYFLERLIYYLWHSYAFSPPLPFKVRGVACYRYPK
jgi:hypothetical protein